MVGYVESRFLAIGPLTVSAPLRLGVRALRPCGCTLRDGRAGKDGWVTVDGVSCPLSRRISRFRLEWRSRSGFGRHGAVSALGPRRAVGPDGGPTIRAVLAAGPRSVCRARREMRGVCGTCGGELGVPRPEARRPGRVGAPVGYLRLAPFGPRPGSRRGRRLVASSEAPGRERGRGGPRQTLTPSCKEFIFQTLRIPQAVRDDENALRKTGKILIIKEADDKCLVDKSRSVSRTPVYLYPFSKVNLLEGQ